MRPNKELRESRRQFVRDFARIDYNTTPGDAQFLRILIETRRAKRGLEIGTATGYGAIVMGLGFERNGGHLTTVDPDAAMVRTARHNLRKMRLENVVTVVKGRGLQVIPKLPGPFDFVFVDAIKQEYLGYWQCIQPKLTARAVVVADNVIQYADLMQDFLDATSKAAQYQSVVIRASEEKNDGMLVLYKAT